jgi:hypothetical protein
MTFGSLLSIVGILLFIKMGVQGQSIVKMFGFEFQLGGSALVVFVVGVVIFLIYVIKPVQLNPDFGHEPFRPRVNEKKEPVHIPHTPMGIPPRQQSPLTLADLFEKTKDLPDGDLRNTVELVISETLCRQGDSICDKIINEIGFSLPLLEDFAKRRGFLSVIVPQDQVSQITTQSGGSELLRNSFR